MAILELLRMARRGAEDGYDRDWYSLFTSSPRVLGMMHQAADETLAQLKAMEKKAAVDRTSTQGRKTPLLNST